MGEGDTGHSRAEVWWQGLVAGLIGYAIVVFFFGFANLFEDESFFRTAALLGHTLLGSADVADAEVVQAGPALAYNGVHLLLFLLFGFAASWLFEETERHPSF